MRPGSLFPSSCHISIIRGPHGAELMSAVFALHIVSTQPGYTAHHCSQHAAFCSGSTASFDQSTPPLIYERFILTIKVGLLPKISKMLHRFGSCCSVGYCYLLAVMPPFVCQGDDGQSLNKTICKANIENAAGSPAQPSPASPAWPSC